MQAAYELWAYNTSQRDNVARDGLIQHDLAVATLAKHMFEVLGDTLYFSAADGEARAIDAGL